MRFTSLFPVLPALALLAGVPAAAGDPPPGPGEGSCLESGCHDGLAAGSTVHAPVDGGMCEACHQSTGEGHGYKLVSAEIVEMCTACHEDPAAGMATVHGPVAAGECTTCHDPHGSDQGALLLSPAEELCITCHEDPSESTGSVHAPAAAGECTTCHSPHGSPQAALLTAPVEELCVTCHEAPEVSEEPDRMVHMPAAEGMCTSCHSPHGSAQEALLLQKGKDVCLACHDGIGGQLALASVHGTIESTGCHTCHDPHGPAGPFLLRSSGNVLCMACHAPKVPREGEEELAEAKLAGLMGMDEEELAAVPKVLLVQGRGHPSAGHPVAGATDPRDPDAPFWCGSCHTPHGSSKKRLLVGGEGFGLCAQCHRK